MRVTTEIFRLKRQAVDFLQEQAQKTPEISPRMSNSGERGPAAGRVTWWPRPIHPDSATVTPVVPVLDPPTGRACADSLLANVIKYLREHGYTKLCEDKGKKLSNSVLVNAVEKKRKRSINPIHPAIY